MLMIALPNACDRLPRLVQFNRGLGNDGLSHGERSGLEPYSSPTHPKVTLMKIRYFKRNLLLAALVAATSVPAMSAMAADQPIHVRGTITDVTGTGFTVQTDAGPRTIVIAADTRITGVVPSSLDQIQPGSFIGSANVPNGSTSRALEVVVFPLAMKGSGLGDYAWDLPAQGHGASAVTSGSAMASAMTNGTVKTMNQGVPMSSAMTNGTVKSATGSGDRTIVVDYGKGEKSIDVPADAPVVTFELADKSAIVKGAHVFVAANPGNPITARVVAVGIHGTVPPM
jgi:hypothetical protein